MMDTNTLPDTASTNSTSTNTNSRNPNSTNTNSEGEACIDLRAGLAAEMIDGRLLRAVRGLALTNYVLAFYLHELEASGKYRDLGYRCFAQYADQRLCIDPRRARELSRAGGALRRLTRIDRACREGLLCWTQAELLTHGVDESEQNEWIDRAARVSCLELSQMLRRHRKGLPVEKGADGGLPRGEFELHVTLPAALHDKLEAVRRELMRKRGKIVDDSEVLAVVLAKFEVPHRDETAEAARAAACEQDETPDWLRKKVIARDDGCCQACGTTESLHVHHVEFRSRGGATVEANLVTVCLGCHGLIHEGRLFARGQAPDSLTFENRGGEPLLAGGSMAMGARPPRTVLRLLQSEESLNETPLGETTLHETPLQETPLQETPRSSDGGQPPRAVNPPDPITPEWFVENMHRFEPGRDGVWRPIRRRKGRKRRSTAVG